MMRGISLHALEVSVPVGLVALWWYLGDTALTSFYFPALRDIWATFRATWLFARVGSDVVPTMTGIVLGYATSVVLGVTLGVTLGGFPRVNEFISPLLEFFRALPAIAAVPIFIVLIGVSLKMEVAVVTFAALWPILLNARDAVAGVDPVVRDTSRSYRIRPVDRLLRVTLPSASPQIVAGMRVALTQSIVIIIVSELIVSARGIGHYIQTAQWDFDITAMWSGLILIGLIGFALSKLFQAFEYKVLTWHRGLHGKAQR